MERYSRYIKANAERKRQGLSSRTLSELRENIREHTNLDFIKSTCDRLTVHILTNKSILFDAMETNNATVLKYLIFDKGCDPGLPQKNKVTSMSFSHRLKDSNLILRLVDHISRTQPNWLNQTMMTRSRFLEEEGQFCVYVASYASFLDYWLTRDSCHRLEEVIIPLIERGCDVNKIQVESLPVHMWDTLFEHGLSMPVGNALRRMRFTFLGEFLDDFSTDEDGSDSFPHPHRFLHAGFPAHDDFPAKKVMKLFCASRAVVRRNLGGVHFKVRAQKLLQSSAMVDLLSETNCCCLEDT